MAMVHLMETSGREAGAVWPGRSQPLAWQGALVHRWAGQGLPMPPLLLRPPVRLQGALTPAVQVLQLVALQNAAEAQLRAQLQGGTMSPVQQQLVRAQQAAPALAPEHAVTATMPRQHPGTRCRCAQRWAL